MTRLISIGGHGVACDVADTPWLRQRGLSGHASLSDGKGMLFDFEETSWHRITTSPMTFPIDIVFVREDGVIVAIVRDAPPREHAIHAATCRWVVELAGGWCTRHKVLVGDRIQW